VATRRQRPAPQAIIAVRLPFQRAGRRRHVLKVGPADEHLPALVVAGQQPGLRRSDDAEGDEGPPRRHGCAQRAQERLRIRGDLPPGVAERPQGARVRLRGQVHEVDVAAIVALVEPAEARPRHAHQVVIIRALLHELQPGVQGSGERAQVDVVPDARHAQEDGPLILLRRSLIRCHRHLP